MVFEPGIHTLGPTSGFPSKDQKGCGNGAFHGLDRTPLVIAGCRIYQLTM